MDTIKAQIGARSLPEQLFVNSGLRLTHVASGTVFDFSALSSLRQWHAAALPPVQVYNSLCCHHLPLTLSAAITSL